jgi:hypothetical protein
MAHHLDDKRPLCILPTPSHSVSLTVQLTKKFEFFMEENGLLASSQESATEFCHGTDELVIHSFNIPFNITLTNNVLPAASFF